MVTFSPPKFFPALAVCLLLIAPVLAHFLVQNSQPSPTPSLLALPSASPTASPARSPSPTPLPGAQNFHQWGSITVFNGLPSDSVRAISQTPDGVMWFGTDNGLARFDGRRVQNFSLGGMDADRVLALKATPTGELWIGTRAGAFIYSEGNFKPVEGTQNVGITAILLSREISLGTDSGLVLRVKPDESGTLTGEKMYPDPVQADDGSPLSVTSLVENDGRLLAGTPGGGVFVVKDGSVSEFPTSPRPIFVNSLARSETGKLWLGSDAAKGASGIYLAEGGPRSSRVAAPTANVLTVEANESGLWAGTERYGLFHIAESKLTKTYTFENTSGGLRSDTIYTLFTDREGVIWIGTNRGVSRFDRLGPFQQTVSDIPNSNFIRTLFQYGRGYPVFAGSNRGLFRHIGEKWVQVGALRDKPVYSVSTKGEDAEAIIVATPEGVFDRTGKLILEGDSRAINYFAGRTYVAVFGRGVFDITRRFPRLIFANNGVTALGGYRQKMWIGTAADGLFSFDGENVNLEVGPEILKSGTIWMVSGSSDKALNIGKEEIIVGGQHGVFIVRDRVPEQLLIAEDVRDVIGIEDDFLAATTSHGVIHAKKDARFGWLFARISFEQGLPSEKTFAFLPTEDQFLIATNRGIVDLKSNPVAPKLIPLRILSQRVHDLNELRSTIALEYPQNSLLVEVAGQSSRTFPEEFQYAFVLTNSKGDVLDSIVSNDPQYAPKDLKPGEYIIESIAFNRDLLASEPLLIRFSVAKAPFPWTATALGVLLGVAVIALIWAVIERRRIVLSNRELAAARFDLANEAERERSRIARDLHDQTLADLRNLMMKSDKFVPAETGLREDIESISTEVRRICEDLSPSVLENVGLVAALEFLLSHTVEIYKFDSADAADEKITFPINVQLQIYRIAQEVLTNIDRHANATLVEMTISTPEPGHFEMSISDDGIPFFPSSAKSHSGRGIGGIRSCASLINAWIEWGQMPDGRPRFILHIKPYVN